MNHTEYMRRALELAQQAAEHGDVPVGCVIVKDGEIIGEGRNRREEHGDATAHAEMEAIRQACARIGSWRLHGCTMYVTLEPCPMCAGALAWSQIGRVVYGASDSKRGFTLFSPSLMHPKTEVVSGVLSEECGNIVSDFFRNKRS